MPESHHSGYDQMLDRIVSDILWEAARSKRSRAEILYDLARRIGIEVLRIFEPTDLAHCGVDVDLEGLETAYGPEAPAALTKAFCDNIEHALFCGDDPACDYALALTEAADKLGYALAVTSPADADLKLTDHIGHARLTRVLAVTDLLRAASGPIPPYTDCYRLNDMAEYVTADAWERIWSAYPDWYPKVWMITDNGDYDEDDVAAMTLAEALDAFDDPDLTLEYAYFTDSGEEGIG